MKKIISTALTAALSASLLVMPVQALDSATETISYNYVYDAATGYADENIHTREMEKLDRGLVAVKLSNKVFLSWRLMSSEDTRYGSAESNVEFNVYRDGTKIATVTDKTNYTDVAIGTSYSVAPVIDGVEGEMCEAVSVWSQNYIDIPLTVPDGITVNNLAGEKLYDATYFPADCSTGDLDGDGEYEIVVKWTSSERDVGSPGDPAVSGPVRLAAYKLDGTRLWEDDIALGKNVYSSAHTIQFLVYDFDGDGKAEVTCQTSLGSKDATGKYVSTVSADEDIKAFTDEQNENADYRNNYIVVSGEEFLTVFNGETGAAMDTIWLPVPREVTEGDMGASYGDTSGNRSNRFLAAVAYLDGEKPYAVYQRGYYFGRNGRQRTSIAGVSFENGRLNPVYRFDTEKGQVGYYDGAEDFVGQGNHNCTVADVDNDGKDEYITGALCMEVNDSDEFKPRWCTFLSHGDALHIGDYDPTHVGFEFFTVHESAPYGMSVIDADTGEHLLRVEADSDTGRGLMANVGAGGYYQVGSARTASFKSNGGTDFEEISVSPGANFRVFWDEDLYDESLDGTTASSYNGSGWDRVFSATGCTKINGSKSNPGLQADILGDWREELIYPTTDGTALRVFTTTTATDYKIKTLMQDPVYRSGVAAQQTAYNQPPHVGIYMGEEVFLPEVESIEITKQPTTTVFAQGDELNTDGMTVKANYVDGTSGTVDAFSVEGYDAEKIGKQTITVSYLGNTASFEVEVKAIEKIEIETPPTKTVYTQGQEIDTTGMKVKAYFEGGLERYVDDYELSGYKPFVSGNQTITVTYREMTATFEVAIKAIVGVEVKAPSKTSYAQGQSLNVSDMIVYAVYEDGTKAETKDYIYSGYNSQTVGTQTITVALNGFTTTFTVTVTPASIASLNGTYKTSSTETVATDIPIGSHSGTFMLEHKFKIDSLPANSANDKNSTAGFLVKFMPQKVGEKTGVGAGWQISVNNNQPYIQWKADGRRPTTVTSSALAIGEEYTFRYTFNNVGTGDGATVNLSILDKNGTEVGKAENQSLRNMTSSPNHISLPMTYISVFNQAQENSTSSITISDVQVYNTNEIVSVDGKNITLNVNSTNTAQVYAAKYENGTLTQIESVALTKTGTNVAVSASFEPDKVFIWSGVRPIDVWEKTAE